MPQPTERLAAWSSSLGLMAVPLVLSPADKRYVILNGSRGNFCLETIDADADQRPEAPQVAWSCNVGHYVGFYDDQVWVRRWDRGQAIERYSASSVDHRLQDFHQYLEQSTPNTEHSVVAHALRVFRTMRAASQGAQGLHILRAFLRLLADAAERAIQVAAGQDWGIRGTREEMVGLFGPQTWAQLGTELLKSTPVNGAQLRADLLLRHASGVLFQEAHYATHEGHGQLYLDGILPPPARRGQLVADIGLHFTPAALARTVVEQTIRARGTLAERVRVFDPACGSGEFLREAVRQLRLSGYQGAIDVIGWDISQAAVEMAEFALAFELHGESYEHSVTFKCHDSLAEGSDWPVNIDLVLMNPPFISWQGMSPDRRELISTQLAGLVKHRPDYSAAFLWRAAACLAHGGAIGCVLPSSTLDGASVEGLRVALAETLRPHTVARLGSHQIFQDATVDAGLFIATRKPSTPAPVQSQVAPLSVWVSHGGSSHSAALRSLRQVTSSGNEATLPIDTKAFSIYRDPDLLTSARSWAPRRYSAWSLLHRLAGMPVAGDLFDVRQGVLTGHNRSFLLDAEHYAALPPKERKYFLPAIVNSSIRDGQIKGDTYVFYPHGERELASEAELKRTLPVYYKAVLAKHREALKARKLVGTNGWWTLTRHRSLQEESSNHIVSTYFGDSGSFAWDRDGTYAVVQGYAWLLRGAKQSPRVWFSYLAILSSPVVSELLSAVSVHVGGGQWNLSKRYVSLLPLPDLTSETFPVDLLRELAAIGEAVHKGGLSNASGGDSAVLAELAEAAYGLSSA
jgi:adenine-specific DNA-methyltransferase